MKRLLLSWLFLIATIVNAQITLGGTSTSQGQVPIDVNYGYNYTQQIFTKQEIHADMAGNVTGLKFYLPSAASISNSTNWTVYLGHTTKTSFSSITDWVALADLTQVFTGAVSQTGGQLEITFATAFPYNNMDNLVVAVLEDTPNFTATSNRFYYYDGVSNNSIYYRNDTTVPNPATPPSATSRTSQKSRITFMGLNLSPLPFCAGLNTPTASQLGLALKTPFTWNAASGATGYMLSVGTTPGASDVINNFDVGNVTQYTLTQAQQLNPLTQYYYRITAYNTAGSATGCFERDFTTTTTAPTNDECANAVALTVNPDLNCTVKTAGNTLGATLSMAAAPCSGNPDDDVWYSFVATSTAHVVTLSDVVATGASSTSTDMYFQVLSGACGSTTSLLCSDPNTSIFGGLTVGQTYYVRVYSYSGTGVNQSFNICVSTPPTPPANDECAGAIALTVNPDYSCAAVTSGNTLNATQSMAAGACGGTPDDDIWYSFVATSARHKVSLTNIVSTGATTSTDMYFQVLSGSCGTLTSVKCSDPNSTDLTGLTPGQTYYVRVYTYYDAGYNASFDICIGTPPPPPANDDCSGAINLTVNPDYSCAATTQGTTVSATSSAETAPSCGATGTNDDVWFKFTATSTSHLITLTNVSGSTDMAMSIASGTCGNLVNVQCSDPNAMSVTGLTVGQEYKVRVWTWSANIDTEATFDICVGTPPPPPSNDDCANATSLTVNNSDAFVNVVNGTTVSATPSTETAPTCSASGINDDVWYSFTATSATHVVHVLYSDNKTTTQIYSGVCGSLTAVTCFAGDYGNSNVLLENLTVGQTYYVRVFSTTNTATTTSNFQIAVTTPSTVNNDTCATATAISCNGTVQGSNALAADEVLPSSTCGGTTTTASYKGVWFTVTATENGPITINACGTQYDSYLRVYTGGCSGLTCFANTSGVGYADAGCTSNLYNAPTVTFTGVAGTTYYILLTGYSAVRLGNYTVSVTQGCSNLGTNDVKANENNIKAYPNPFTDVLNISDVSNVKSISIMDVSGKLVKTFAKAETSLNLNGLNSGMYLVVLNMKDGSKQTIKAIKK